jgi:hypothetical protein
MIVWPGRPEPLFPLLLTTLESIAMNTDALARHYDKLTPLERLPLIVAAAARGDEAERKRLTESAPRKWWRVPDYFSATLSLQHVSDYHLLTLVDLAATYFAALADAAEQEPKKDDDSPLGAAWEKAFVLGYHVKTNLAGWRKFCADLNIDPECGWRMLPGFKLVKQAEKMAEPDPETGILGAAFLAQGVARYFASEAGNPKTEVDDETLQKFWPPTADDVAAGLRRAWDGLQEKWK